MDPKSQTDKPMSDDIKKSAGGDPGQEGTLPEAEQATQAPSQPSAPVPPPATSQEPPAKPVEPTTVSGSDGKEPSLGNAQVPTQAEEKPGPPSPEPAKPSPMTSSSAASAQMEEKPSLAEEAAEVLKNEESKVIDVTKAPPAKTDNKEPGDVTIIPKKKRSKVQYIVAIVLFILAIGGAVFLAMIYFFPTDTDETESVEEQLIGPTPTVTMEPSPVVDELEPLPSPEESDEINALESDLESTSVSDLDPDLSTLESELAN